MAGRNVQVEASITLDGLIMPKRIYLDSNQSVVVDKVLEIRDGINLKTKSPCVRFRILAKGKQFYLYKTNDIWSFEEQGNEKDTSHPANVQKRGTRIKMEHNQQ